MKVHRLATGLVCAALALSFAVETRAQTEPSTPATTSAAMPLELELGRSKLDAEAVRKAIELELKRPVVLSEAPKDSARLSVTVHENHTVTVSYRTSTGETRTRSVGIPEDSTRGAEIIALLSGNLTRDEAAELLAELAAKAAPPATIAGASEGTPESAASAEGKNTPPPAPEPPARAEPPPPPPTKQAQPSAPPPLIQTPFPSLNLSLFAPVALYPQSERRIFAAELGLFYSRIGELHGLGLNVFVLHTERDVRGVSFAAFYNSAGGKVTGVSSSALVNRRQRLRGLEVGGLLNLGSSAARGASAAGLANFSGDFVGVQAGGLMNWTATFQGVQTAGLMNRANDLEGVQTAGFMNWAGASQGLQIAGGANVAENFEGLQAVGGVNVAKAISGLQLGVVNVAEEVHGVQLGVVNVAKRVKGTSIGLVSVAENGRIQPVLWASSAQLLNAAAKFTVGPLYTQAGLGYAPGEQTYTYEIGLGGHVSIGRFFVEPGVHYSEMRSSDHPFDQELIEYGHYRVAVGMDLGRVSPFGGAGVLQRFAHSVDAPDSVPISAEFFGGVAFF